MLVLVLAIIFVLFAVGHYRLWSYGFSQIVESNQDNVFNLILDLIWANGVPGLPYSLAIIIGSYFIEGPGFEPKAILMAVITHGCFLFLFWAIYDRAVGKSNLASQ